MTNVAAMQGEVRAITKFFYGCLIICPSHDSLQLLQETFCFCVIPHLSLFRDCNMENT